MKTKIAVEVSGYLRSFSNFTIDNWKENLLSDDFDFFFHTYIERGLPKTTLYNIDLNDRFTE